MIDEIRQWLRKCPLIDKGDRFNVNYLGADPLCYTLEETPNIPILIQYLDGSSLREKIFVVASRDEYGADVLVNITNSGFWEQFEKWVESQNRKKSFPKMGENQTPRKIEITSSHYLFETSETTARYQIQMKLTYYQKGERT